MGSRLMDSRWMNNSAAHPDAIGGIAHGRGNANWTKGAVVMTGYRG